MLCTDELARREREHVTVYMYEHPELFSCLRIEPPPELGQVLQSLDERLRRLEQQPRRGFWSSPTSLITAPAPAICSASPACSAG